MINDNKYRYLLGFTEYDIVNLSLRNEGIPDMKNKYSEYTKKYAKEKLKRIPLDMKIEEYNLLKDYAASANESVNGYIKKAVRNRMDQESKITFDKPTEE